VVNEVFFSVSSWRLIRASVAVVRTRFIGLNGLAGEWATLISGNFDDLLEGAAGNDSFTASMATTF
jgi:hypothetical protein